MKASSNFWLFVVLVLLFVSCETQLPKDPKDPKTKNLHNVTIESSILPDSVYVENGSDKKDLSLKGNQISLEPGEYELHLKKDGYEDVTQRVKIEKEKKDYKFSVDWFEKKYQLEVNVSYDVNPVSPDELVVACYKGGQVYCAGSFSFTAPKGKYEVKLVHPGYEEKIESFEITSKAKSLEVMLKALPRNFAIDMVCGDEKIDSAGAKIIIDGNTQLGNTINPGAHVLEIELDGYKKFSESIFVQGAGKPFQYEAKLTKEEKVVNATDECTLVIKTYSNYPAAGTGVVAEKITVNGVSLSDKSSFVAGEYELVVEHKDYQQVKKSISLSGSEKVLEIELLPALQKVTVEVLGVNNEKMMPDTMLVDGKAFDGKLVPGKHTLMIVKSGYNTLQQELNVGLSQDQKYEFSMAPLPRKVIFTIKNKETGEELSVDSINVNNQKYSMQTENSFVPGTIDVVIEKEGFEKYQKTFSVLPGTKEEYLTIDLSPKKDAVVLRERTISLVITSDSAPEQVIYPQIVTVNGLPLSKNLKLEQGTYPITIFHPGHFPYNQSIEVSSGEGTFEAKIVLESQTRSVVTVPQYDVAPDGNAALNVRIVNQKTQQEIILQDGVRVKPGKYYIFVDRVDYSYTGAKEISVLPGLEEFELLVSLKKNVDSSTGTETNTTDVVDSSTGTETNTTDVVDSSTGTETNTTDVVDSSTGTETNTTDVVDSSTGTETNTTDVVDSSTGTETNTTDVVDSSTGTETNTTDVVDSALECSVDLKLSSSFGSNASYSVNPITATLGGVDISSRSFSPGEYDLVVIAEGYEDIREKIFVPQEKNLNLKYSLTVAQREVIFDLMTDHPGSAVNYDKVFVDGESFSGKVFPGEHVFTVKKDGYDDWIQEAYVDLGHTGYVVKGLLKAKKRLIQLDFVNQKTQEKLTDIIVKVNNLGTSSKDVSMELFPGEYDFSFEKEGFHPKSENISVVPSHEPMSVKIVLEPKPEEKKIVDAVVNLKVFSDSDLESEIRADILTIDNQSYMPGLKLSPGNYSVVAYKSGHQMYQNSVLVEDGQETASFDIVLECTLRSMEVTYNYDITPAPSYPSCKLELTHIASKNKFSPEYGQMVKPGKYLVTATQVGYVYKGEKEIFIEPGSGSYHLEIAMVREGEASATDTKEVKVEEKSVERALKIRGVHPQTFEKITPYRILIGGRVYQNEMLKIGQEIALTVLFSGSKTYNKTVTIPEGSGEFEILIDLLVLRKVVLTSNERGIAYDGINYEYEFKINKADIERHLLSAYEVGGKVEFHLFVDPEINDITVFGGYRFEEKSLVKDTQAIGRLSKIDVFRLIEHLTTVYDSQGENALISALKDVMSYEMSIRKDWKFEQKEEFLYYMQSLELQEESSMSALNDMINKMEKMLE